jgi:hypothetical protein
MVNPAVRHEPETHVALLRNEAGNQIRKGLGGSDWVGEHQRRTADLLVRKEAAFVAEMLEPRLVNRRKRVGSPSMLSHQRDADRQRNTAGGTRIFPRPGSINRGNPPGQ